MKSAEAVGWRCALCACHAAQPRSRRTNTSATGPRARDPPKSASAWPSASSPRRTWRCPTHGPQALHYSHVATWTGALQFASRDQGRRTCAKRLVDRFDPFLARRRAAGAARQSCGCRRYSARCRSSCTCRTRRFQLPRDGPRLCRCAMGQPAAPMVSPTRRAGGSTTCT